MTDPAKVAMGRRNKRKGSRNEIKTRNRLRLYGFHVVKAGGSLGVFDLIAFNAVEIKFIQVKSNRPAGPAERESMIAMRHELPPNSSIELWVWQDRARNPIIKRNDEINLIGA